MTNWELYLWKECLQIVPSYFHFPCIWRYGMPPFNFSKNNSNNKNKNKEFVIEKVRMDNINVFLLSKIIVCNSHISRISSKWSLADIWCLNWPLHHIALNVHVFGMANSRRTPDPTLRSRSKSPNKSRSPYRSLNGDDDPLTSIHTVSLNHFFFMFVLFFQK